MSTSVLLWGGFNLAVVALLAVDLGLVRRGKETAVTPKEAGVWTAVWISLSLGFCGLIWWLHRSQPGLFLGQNPPVEWLTAYIIEYALSVDNLFVFLMLFGYFRVKPEHQHRVLFWGIMGAFVMRAALILAGAALVKRFDWLLALFGAFLVFTALKMLKSEEDEVDPEQQAIVRLARKVLPVARIQEGSRFFTVERGMRMVTPLFLVLLSVEFTDLLFALDSIPAVLGISQDPYIIYTSNVCAILGLRSLFFVVASLMDKFHYLKLGLSVILGFVGVKMLVGWGTGELAARGVLDHAFHVPIGWSLGFIAAALVGSIVASVLNPKVPEPARDSPEDIK
ncbi:MAG: TerC family protein [Myxococcaceae bacterium]|nr:TerC family protein [Myxococcaceae bacterium]